MRIRRAWAMVMAIIMSVSLTLGNTIAYLQDEDYAVNVMTVGNVDIKLVEKERDPATGELQGYNDNKPLLPAVYPETDEPSLGAEMQFPTGGSAALWADTTKNVVDKMVFVENVGRSDAYIRVWFAFEQGSMTEEDFNRYVLLNKDTQHWNWEDVAYNVAIDDNVYAIKAATYNGGADVHVGGILPKGETTRPSLLQLLIDKTADNRELQAIDGNSDGMYNVLVVSQGTQIMGFADAEQALNVSFNNGLTCEQMPVEVIQTWFGGMVNEDAGEEEEEIDLTNYDKADNVQQLQDFIQQLNDEPVDDNNPDQLPQAFVHVRENMELEALNLESGELNLYIEAGKTLKLGEADVSGWNLLSTAKAEGDGYIHVGKRAKVNVTGKGDIVSHADAVFNLAGGKLTINTKGNIICNTEEGSIFLVEGQYGGGQSVSTATIKKGNFEADYLSYGGNLTVNIEGGTFSMTRESLKEDVLTSQDEVESGWYDSALVYNITGGTFAGDGEEPTATPTAKPTATPTAEPTPAPTPVSNEFAVANLDDLKAAVARANLGNDVVATLTQDIDITEQLKLTGGSLTLKGSANITGINKMFLVQTKIVFSTTGKVSAPSCIMNTECGPEIVINSGTFEYSWTLTDCWDGERGRIIVNGGSFPVSRSEFVPGDVNMEAIINGGEFQPEVTPTPTPAPTPALPSTITSEADLQAVVAALNNGTVSEHQVSLGSNVTLTENLTLQDGELDIDLNGYNLTSNQYIQVYEGSSLSIEGEGDVTGTFYKLFSMYGGDLRLDVDGIVTCYDDIEMGTIFYADNSVYSETNTAEAQITILDGQYEIIEETGALTYGGHMNIVIEGGTFNFPESKLESEAGYSNWLVTMGDYETAIRFDVNGGTFAEESTPELLDTVSTAEELQALLTALEEGAAESHEVKLGADIDMGGTLDINNSILTIDLNGHTLKAYGDWEMMSSAICLRNANLKIEGTGNVIGYNAETFSLWNNSSLTVDVNGNVENHWTYENQMAGKFFIYDYDCKSPVVLNNGNFVADDDLDAFVMCDTNWGPDYDYLTKLTINGGTYGWTENFIREGCEEGKITFVNNGGTFAAEPEAPALPSTVTTAEQLQAVIDASYEDPANLYEVKLGADITMPNGLGVGGILTIDLNGYDLNLQENEDGLGECISIGSANRDPENDYAIISYGHLTIEGEGNVYCTSSFETIVGNSGNLTVDITGDFHAITERSSVMICIWGSDCDIQLKNGNFKAENSAGVERALIGGDPAEYQKLTITGGTYPWTKTAIENACKQMNENFVVSITGGTFMTEVEVADEDDLATAFAALENGGELEAKLVQDVKLTSSKTLEGGKLTLNMNGHTITTDDFAMTDSCSLEVSGGDLTVKGNGNLTWTCDSAVFVGAKGSITVNINGDVSSNGFIRDTDMETGEPFEVPNGKIFRYVGEDAHITVNSGTYSNNTEFGMVDAYGCTGENSLTLNGGTFLYSEEELEEQCQSVTYKNNGAMFIETVSSFSELYSAMYASQDGVTTTVKLMNDIVVNDDLVFDAGNMTIDLNGHDIVCEMTNPEEEYTSKIFVEGGNLTVQGEGNLSWHTNAGIFHVRAGKLTVKVSGNVTNTGMFNDQAQGYIFMFIGSGAYVTMNGGHYAASYQIVDGGLADDSNNTLFFEQGYVDATERQMRNWCGENVSFSCDYGEFLEY